MSIYVPLNILINAKVQNPKYVIFAYLKEHSVCTSQQIHVWVIMGCAEKSQSLEMQEDEGTTVIWKLAVTQAEMKVLSTLVTYLHLPVLMEEDRNGMKDRKENKVG